MASLLRGYPELTGIFFEKKPEFSWHDGMDIEGATIQVAPIKDLVTLSDPTSCYSFLSYLHSKGRLYHFLNARFDGVSRKEFNDYMKWASQNNDLIHFGQEVREVSIAPHGGFLVRTASRTVSGRNLAIGVGTAPNIPNFAVAQPDNSHFHVVEFIPRAKDVRGREVVVVGGGQSGAEAFLDLVSRDAGQAPRLVRWISRRENFLPMDDSPFTNEYFMPCHSDHFYRQDLQFRRGFLRRNVLASDGISEATLREIYQRIYTLRFVSRRPPLIALSPGSDVVGMMRVYGGWRLEVRDTLSEVRHSVKADMIVWATGFRPRAVDFLAPLASRFEWEADEIRIDDDFAAIWDGPVDHRVFMLNAAPGQRGLADPNLSLMAWRSQRVLDRIRGNRAPNAAQRPAFVPWSEQAARESEVAGLEEP